MKSNWIVVFFIGVASATPVEKQYRSDYVYNARTDAFYNLHTKKKSELVAKEICRYEGGKMMSLESKEELVQAHALLKQKPDAGDAAWVTSQSDGSEEQTSSHFSDTCDSINRKGEKVKLPCHREMAFICKVRASEAPFDVQCNVFGNNYTYVSSVGSCYKISTYGLTWYEALEECQHENAHLVILNSVAEHDAVKNILETVKQEQKNVKWPWFVLAGIKAIRPAPGTEREFKTVFGQHLNETGYNVWSPGEPSNTNDHEYCGSIFKNDGNYNDLNCREEYTFMCEKELQQ